MVHLTARTTRPLPLILIFLIAITGPSKALAQTEAAAAGMQEPGASQDYSLAAGDLLRIQVYQQPDLSMELRIQENGELRYPLLGPLRLQGLSVGQAERLIEAGLREGRYLRQPQVAITVLQVRGHLATVLGQVQRPGRFPVESPGLRLSELLAQAGGVTPVGSERLTLLGVRGGLAFRQTLELSALFDSPHREQDPVVQGGDVVFVDRAPVVYVYGEVQRPGPLRLERDMTVLQGLAAGGGPTSRGTARGLQLTRREPQGRLRSWVPALEDLLQPGDVLRIPESLF